MVWARPEMLGWVHGRREAGLKTKQCCPKDLEHEVSFITGKALPEA